MAAFGAIFAALAVLEWRFERREHGAGKAGRWYVNLGMFALGVVLVRFSVGALAITAAAYAEAAGFGVFNQVAAPFALEAIVAILILDLALYGQHVATHKAPALWRLHQVHHADVEMDITTGLRFHPIEIVLSLLWKGAVVLALGADPWIVLAYEVLLNGFALFTHANIRLVGPAERAVRLIFATPEMHRVHHSADPAETDSNYGNIFSIWDRLFGTYRRDPAGGDAGLRIGLGRVRDQSRLGLGRMLLAPFRERL
jgi:sterol desaturase/sphingolipid hydroxylase (fatty acid hydroxylase superfamily)